MGDFVPFGSRESLVYLLGLMFARGMDVLSTWTATPNLLLEANPITRKLGWRLAIPVNIVLCLGFACWPLPAIVITVTSLMVAARNFQFAWLMRAMGEENYRQWFICRPQERSPTLFMFCLLAQTLLTSAVGTILIVFNGHALVSLGVGVGLIGYGGAVLVFTLIPIARRRRRGF